MEFFDSFPFTKLQGKNRGLDWVIQKVTEFKKVVDNIPETVNKAVDEAVKNGVDFNVDTDKSLTVADMPADSKAVGDRIDSLTADDVNAAPKGFGLGVVNPAASQDVCVENGFYNPANKPQTTVYKLSDNFIYQDARTTAQGGLQTITTRQRWNGVWGEFEHYNPVMEVGVEYRTIERFNIKPVYTKIIDCGSGPNNAEKTIEHKMENVIVFDFGGYMYHADGSVSIPWQNYSLLSVDSTKICIKTSANYSPYNAYVWVKYYKTTD